MPVHKILKAQSPWIEIRSTADDWAAADPQLLGTMLTSMSLIRAFEGKFWISHAKAWSTALRILRLAKKAVQSVPC